LVKKLKGRKHLKHLGINMRIILKWFLKKQGMRIRTGFSWLRIGNNLPDNGGSKHL
jgi:hypothetical protein